MGISRAGLLIGGVVFGIQRFVMLHNLKLGHVKMLMPVVLLKVNLQIVKPVFTTILIRKLQM